MIVLLIAAIGTFLAGVLAILYGIPVKEFSFGNTMVLSGVIAICTALVLFGLWLAMRELRAVAQRIAMPASGGLHDPSLPELRAPPAKPPFPQRPPVREPVIAELPPAKNPPPVVPPFPQEDMEDYAPPDRFLSAAEPAPEPPLKPRRNLLFESSVRKDRDRAPAAGESVPEAPQRTVFDDPIAQRGADRADRLQRTRSPSTFSQPKSNLSDVTVLKSGVVDGMSYSLYSDGSIEAQMPEGMMRFTSIDELRTHLDQRGA